jgi:hypothetical protein
VVNLELTPGGLAVIDRPIGAGRVESFRRTSERKQKRKPKKQLENDLQIYKAG